MVVSGHIAVSDCVPVVCHSATRLLRPGLNEQLRQTSRGTNTYKHPGKRGQKSIKIIQAQRNAGMFEEHSLKNMFKHTDTVSPKKISVE